MKMNKTVMNMAYGIGAAIVVLGALFKILHWPFAKEMLIIGMGTEALIFFISAFESPGDQYHWENVYPELLEAGAVATKKEKKKKKETTSNDEAEVMLSHKLDKLLHDAKIDVDFISGLKTGIENFQTSVDDLSNVATSTVATQKYQDQISIASNHLESLNALYTVQLEKSKVFSDSLTKTADDSQTISEQFSSLATNMSALNNVYGNMLSAMNFNKG